MSACIYRQALFAILVCISSFVCSSAKAHEIRTYQFLNNGNANLIFGGGLISGNSFASPTGTFDITITEDGSATITRFDVNVTNVIVDSDGASVFTEGESLGNFFFGVEPAGLQAEIHSFDVFSSRPIVIAQIQVETSAEDIDDFDISLLELDVSLPRSPSLEISLSSFRDREVSVFIRASSGFFLDNPSLRTIGMGSRAILVAVPEPCGLTLIASISLLLLCRCRELPTV